MNSIHICFTNHFSKHPNSMRPKSHSALREKNIFSLNYNKYTRSFRPHSFSSSSFSLLSLLLPLFDLARHIKHKLQMYSVIAKNRKIRSYYLDGMKNEKQVSYRFYRFTVPLRSTISYPVLPTHHPPTKPYTNIHQITCPYPFVFQICNKHRVSSWHS